VEQSPPIYRAAAIGDKSPLCQGEILSTLIQPYLDLERSWLVTNSLQVTRKRHDYVVILTQDCDLEQDFKVRARDEENDKLIPNVLCCEVVEANRLSANIESSKIWKRIRQNNDERYHFLQKADPEQDALRQGLPEMGIDFKRFFTLPTAEVYHRIAIGEAKRRSCINSPYMEHLSRRFTNYLSRIALPIPHMSD
jgi:hypothetical protein